MLHCEIDKNFTQERISPSQSDLTFNLLSNDFPTLHNHNEFWEFLIVLEGSLINNIDHESTQVKPNTVFFLRPNDTHSLNYNGRDNVLYVNFVIADRLIRSIFEEAKISYEHVCARQKALRWQINSDMRMELHKDFLHVLKLQNNEAKEQYKRYILFRLINQLQRFLFTISDDLPLPIQRLQECINQEYVDVLNVDTLSSRMNMSRVSLNKLIRSHYHKTASEFIVEYKMNYAMQLLITSNKHIYEICELLGYTTAAFNKTFKRIYNTLPSSIRKGTPPLHKRQNGQTT